MAKTKKLKRTKAPKTGKTYAKRSSGIDDEFSLGPVEDNKPMEGMFVGSFAAKYPKVYKAIDELKNKQSREFKSTGLKVVQQIKLKIESLSGLKKRFVIKRATNETHRIWRNDGRAFHGNRHTGSLKNKEEKE